MLGLAVCLGAASATAVERCVRGAIRCRMAATFRHRLLPGCNCPRLPVVGRLRCVSVPAGRHPAHRNWPLGWSPGAAAGGTELTRADSRTTNPSLTRRSRRGKIQRSAPPRSAGCRCALWEQGRDIPFSNDGRAVLAIACSWGRRGATTGKALSSARQASRCDAPSGPPHILPRAFPPPRPSCGPNAPPLLRAHAPIPAFP